MNVSNAIHLAVTMTVLFLIGFTTGEWWAGAALPIGFYYGWEVNQQRENIADNKQGTLKTLTLLDGFDITKWCTDAKMDFLPSLVLGLLIAGVAEYVAR